MPKEMPKNTSLMARRHLRIADNLKQLGQFDAAERLYRRILRLDPQAFEAAFQLGLVTEKKGYPDRAARYYHRAIVHNRRYAPPYLRLGQIHEYNNDFYKALMAYGEYLLRIPKSVSGDAYLRFARMLTLLDQDEMALPYYLQSLEFMPADPTTYFLLAETLQNRGDLDGALECFMALGKINPIALPLISFFMGYLLEKNGEYTAALKCYDQALEHPGQLQIWKLKRDLAYPLIMQSREEIETFEKKLKKVLFDFRFALLKKPLSPNNQNHYYFSMLQLNIVHIAYHHYNPLPLRREFAELLPQFLPPVNLPAWQPRSHAGHLIHLGLICAPKSLNMGFAYAGALFNELDPSRFRITVFCNSPKVSQIFNPQNRYCFNHPNASYRVISRDYAEAAKQIRAEELDLLMFTEPSWDSFQYSLSALRLARAQGTSWMNPGTTGMPEMDYFFSSELMERPGAESDYSETLVKFKTLPSHLPLYPFPEDPVSRSDYGLEGVKRLYSCPQTLLKFHPDFDPIVAEILRRDPEGHLALLATKQQGQLCDILLKRFQKTIPDVMDRIWVLPEMPVPDFLGLLRVSDVVLDPLYYGGGTTTYQAMAYGIPIITLPTERMVGRITSALYKKMGLTDTVATDPENYIQLANRYAMNPELRAGIVEGTLAQSILFEDRAIIAEFSEFMEDVVAGRRTPRSN